MENAVFEKRDEDTERERARQSAETYRRFVALTSAAPAPRSSARLYEPDEITARLEEYYNAGVTPARLSADIGVTPEKVRSWYEGHWPQGEELRSLLALLTEWFEAKDRTVQEKVGGYYETSAARKILVAVERARRLTYGDGRIGIAMIFGPSGCGKSFVSKYCARTLPRCSYVQISGETRTFVQVMGAMIGAIDSYLIGTPGNWKRVDLFLEKTQPGHTTIIDGAHRLKPAVIEQLCDLSDNDQRPLVFVGNTDWYGSVYDPKALVWMRMLTRCAGEPVLLSVPTMDDVDSFRQHWKIVGHDEAKYCASIGMREGGLRMLDAIARQATRLAEGSGAKRITLEHLRKAAESAGFAALLARSPTVGG